MGELRRLSCRLMCMWSMLLYVLVQAESRTRINHRIVDTSFGVHGDHGGKCSIYSSGVYDGQCIRCQRDDVCAVCPRSPYLCSPGWG
jgi:hypothetical protein